MPLKYVAGIVILLSSSYLQGYHDELNTSQNIRHCAALFWFKHIAVRRRALYAWWQDLAFSRQQIAAGARYLSRQSALLKKSGSRIKTPVVFRWWIKRWSPPAATTRLLRFPTVLSVARPEHERRTAVPFRQDGQTNPDANSDATDKNQVGEDE